MRAQGGAPVETHLSKGVLLLLLLLLLLVPVISREERVVVLVVMLLLLLLLMEMLEEHVGLLVPLLIPLMSMECHGTRSSKRTLIASLL